MSDADVGELHSLLGRGTRFEGQLAFEGNVRIDGWFKGNVKTDDTLVVGDSAEIEADIQAGSVIVRGGLLRGNIVATRSVEVLAPAKVYGNIAAPEIQIEKGVVFEGQCRMGNVERGPE